MIYQYVYTSLTLHPLKDAGLTEILNVSRTNNTRDQLSGLLIAHEKRFLQVLEGPEPAVKACYARILSDKRHTLVRMLSHGTVNARVFPTWRMGFARPDELAADAKDAVFSIYNLSQGDGADLSPDLSPDLSNETEVARLVRSFLASFGMLGVAGALRVRPTPHHPLVRT